MCPSARGPTVLSLEFDHFLDTPGWSYGTHVNPGEALFAAVERVRVIGWRPIPANRSRSVNPHPHAGCSEQSTPQRFSDGSCVGAFSDGLCVEVSVPISLPVAFPFSIPVGPGDDGRGLCVELVLPIPSAVGVYPSAITSLSPGDCNKGAERELKPPRVFRFCDASRAPDPF